MTLWIKVHSNLMAHPKTSKLADILKLSSKDTSPNVVAGGMLISLWTWAIQNAYNGDLSSCSDRTIAQAANYRKKPEGFVKALTDAGWLDADRHLHDWEEYTLQLTGVLERQKQKNRERVRRYRNKSNTSVTPPCPPVPPKGSNACNAQCNVTEALQKRNVTLTERDRERERDHNILLSHASVPGTDIAPSAPPAPSRSARAFDAEGFSRFWDAYPKTKRPDRETAWEAWRKLAPTRETTALILKNLHAWKLSAQWEEQGGRFIPRPENFLLDAAYRDVSPAPSKHHAIPKGASGELGEAELEAIRRVLQED